MPTKKTTKTAPKAKGKPSTKKAAEVDEPVEGQASAATDEIAEPATQPPEPAETEGSAKDALLGALAEETPAPDFDAQSGAEQADIPGSSGEVSALELAAEEEAERAAKGNEPAPDLAVEEKSPKKKNAKKKAAEETPSRTAQNRERRNREVARAERLERNQEFFGGISSMQAAQRTKAVLRGTVVAVERFPVPPTKSSEFRTNMVGFSVLVDDRFKVIIPFEQFYRDNPIDMDTVDRGSREGWNDYERRQVQMAEKLFGVEVDFVVTNVIANSPTDYAISGSRREALAILEKRNFGGKNPRFEVHGMYPALILSVGNYSMYVTLGGVDANIQLRDVTFEYCPILHKKYKAGDTIDVEIEDMKKRESDGRVVLELSGKGPELRDVVERQKTGILKTETTTTGVITSVRPSMRHKDKIVIRAWLPYFKMPAIVSALPPSSLGIAPKAGDTLRLLVTDIAESGFVHCRCKGFNNTSSVLLGR